MVVSKKGRMISGRNCRILLTISAFIEDFILTLSTKNLQKITVDLRNQLNEFYQIDTKLILFIYKIRQILV